MENFLGWKLVNNYANLKMFENNTMFVEKLYGVLHKSFNYLKQIKLQLSDPIFKCPAQLCVYGTRVKKRI